MEDVICSVSGEKVETICGIPNCGYRKSDTDPQGHIVMGRLCYYGGVCGYGEKSGA